MTRPITAATRLVPPALGPSAGAAGRAIAPGAEPPLGVVVIGRNEGERLKRCLASLAGTPWPVVYVDSGSTDGSGAHARSVGAEVVELDRALPFTAARARNAGIARLRARHPETVAIQFVDGDCEVLEGWIPAALRMLAADPRCGAVAGRRRERHPDGSVYNLLCDIEWNTPVGQATACGGDALVRVAALDAVDAYDSSLIAGEDEDLCVRMRQQGWTIQRIDIDMTLHDAAMTSMRQWWKRTERSGYAFARVHDRHKASAVPHFQRQVRSTLVWGGAVPALLVGAMPISPLLPVLGLALYGHLSWRVARGLRRRGFAGREAWTYGVHCALAKLPQMVGYARFHLDRLRRRDTVIIEYKS
ncbi:glycosyltransferase [Methylorubrum populi]|uniref:Glycosyl transferase group 2 family n=1 Tax=Methylorubrum populi TaxID=223967 RepID=A0A833N0U3_9HYPH|nr:glycosyltransferase [Methylorubrum populi]KAB7785398.1 Glycosyl transferase group 2 family [Methylorubrum populi]